MKLNESFLVGTTSKVSPCFQFPRQCTNDFSTESFTFQFHGIYEDRSFLSFNDSTTHPREREGGGVRKDDEKTLGMLEAIPTRKKKHRTIVS